MGRIIHLNGGEAVYTDIPSVFAWNVMPEASIEPPTLFPATVVEDSVY